MITPKRFPLILAATVSLSLACAFVSRATGFPIATNPAVLEIAGGAVAGSSNYLVGYVAGAELLAQRLAADGRLVGAPLHIGTNPGFPPAAVMAGGRTNCLVAWSDHSITNGVTLFGRMIQPDTGQMGAPFPLLTPPGSRGFQRVLAADSDGDDFLVLWADAADQAGENQFTRVHGRFVTGAGVLAGPEFVALTGTAVAFGKTHYLLAWQDEEEPAGPHDRDHNTYCRTLSPAGDLGSVAKLNTGASRARNPLAIGFDGAHYLVLWNHSPSGGPKELNLLARAVSQDGSPSGPERRRARIATVSR